MKCLACSWDFVSESENGTTVRDDLAGRLSQGKFLGRLLSYRLG